MKTVEQLRKQKETIKLEDLKGLRQLDAIDFREEETTDHWGDLEHACACRFRLDGVVFVAMEDPQDGYRSSMRSLKIDPATPMTNDFHPITVLCKHIAKTDKTDTCDILEIIDCESTEVVLRVGTNYSDDYYPSFVSQFYPDSMILNKRF